MVKTESSRERGGQLESNQRFYAYNHFGQHPERLVAWFDRFMR